MRLIVCLDDHAGMLFNCRRQSSDSKLRMRMLELTGENRLWMHPYSAKQFPELPENVCVDEHFLELAKEADSCFVEDPDMLLDDLRVDQVVIYRWNRCYPADKYFPKRLMEKLLLVSRNDFVGSSHERITEEIYET